MKHRQLVRTLMQTRVCVDNYVRNFTSNGKQGARLSKWRRMAINTQVNIHVGKRKLDLWGCFVGRADMFMRDGLNLSGQGAPVFADELSAAVVSGMGSINNIFLYNIYI